MVPGTWHFRNMVFQLPFELLGASQILKKGMVDDELVSLVLSGDNWLELVYGCQPKNRGRYSKTPKSSHFNRVVHYFHHAFWG